MKASQISPPEDSTALPDKSVSYPFQLGAVHFLKEIEDNYKSLGDALKAGSIASAQNALAALQGNKQTAVAGGTVEATSSSSSQLGANFLALQSALQAGDISTARKAFAAVDQIFEKGYTAAIASGQSPVQPSSDVAQAVSDQISPSPAPADPTAIQPPGSVLSVQA